MSSVATPVAKTIGQPKGPSALLMAAWIATRVPD